jgi:Mn2+/Fe2+ NRAMP family transporter
VSRFGKWTSDPSRSEHAATLHARVGGGALAATNVNPIAMLFWTAVVNGVVAVPIMLAMMVVVSSGGHKGPFALPHWLKALGWLATALMTVAVVLLLVSTLI